MINYVKMNHRDTHINDLSYLISKEIARELEEIVLLDPNYAVSH